MPRKLAVFFHLVLLLLLNVGAADSMTQKVLGAGKMVMRSKAGNAGMEIVGKMVKDLAKKEVKATAKRQDGGKGSVMKYTQIVRGMQSSPGFEAELLKTAQTYVAPGTVSGGPTARMLVDMVKAELKEDTLNTFANPKVKRTQNLPAITRPDMRQVIKYD
jgi:hypothetical protein